MRLVQETNEFTDAVTVTFNNVIHSTVTDRTRTTPELQSPLAHGCQRPGKQQSAGWGGASSLARQSGKRT